MQVNQLELVAATGAGDWLAGLPDHQQAWLASQGVSADRPTEAGRSVALPTADGSLHTWVAFVDPQQSLWSLAMLPLRLPEGEYQITASPESLDLHQAALGWGLGAYQFDRYKRAKRAPAQLQTPAGVDAEQLARELDAVILVRDLINTPTEDMGPDHLAAQVAELAKTFSADYREWVGDELLEHNFPAIHAVGRASHRAPRLSELRWGDPDHPKVTLVGKGVCFDTGGLDMKSTVGMALMKKDMGGAAHVIALARLIMASELPVNLQLLVPSVENAVGPNAYRPGDIIPTRAGLSVEIGNTDAEGRVILCDALAFACEEPPELLIDFATLTGAARVALGTDLPALFCNDDELAEGLLKAGVAGGDPVWRMPLYAPYRRLIEPQHADINNSGVGRYGGAITAALFLQAFVKDSIPWAHLDTYGWCDRATPGRPVGGDALGLRAAFAYLQQRYG